MERMRVGPPRGRPISDPDPADRLAAECVAADLISTANHLRGFQMRVGPPGWRFRQYRRPLPTAMITRSRGRPYSTIDFPRGF